MQNMDYILPNSNNINITDEEFLAMIGNTSTGLGMLDRTSNNLTDYNNMTMVIHYNGYPSGYSIPSIIFASVIVTILMIVIVVGNMLVIIAIATEKALKNIQNWFIASLAVADFFLGLVIMPFSLANELMGYWVFGKFWCDIHSAMDVLLCTASIMNLCLISLDRYWSITKAIEYLKSRTPARAAFMIAFVWVMSGLICIPPLLGWKANEPEGTLPQCQLSQEIGYVLYSALGSFYIPSCIMVFVYIRIYFAAKARARRQLRKQPRKPPTDQVTSFTNPPKGTIPMPSASTNKQTIPIPHNPTQNDSSQKPEETDANKNNNAETTIPIVTCDFASDVSTSEAGGDNEYELKDTLKVNALVTNADNKGKATTMSTSKNDKNVSSSALTVNMSTSNSPMPGRNRALSVGIDADMVSEFDPSSSDSGVVSRCAVVKPLKFRLCQPIFGKKSSKSSNKDNHDYRHNNGEHKKRKNKKKSHAVVVNELEPAIPKPKPRDPEKEKRRIARKKEKRATLILGLIMGSFLACWIPFFFLYILTPFVPESYIPESAFAVAFWLGYMNSALNPAIYTIFNKDFRRAFRRILFK